MLVQTFQWTNIVKKCEEIYERDRSMKTVKRREMTAKFSFANIN